MWTHPEILELGASTKSISARSGGSGIGPGNPSVKHANDSITIRPWLLDWQSNWKTVFETKVLYDWLGLPRLKLKANKIALSS